LSAKTSLSIIHKFSPRSAPILPSDGTQCSEPTHPFFSPLQNATYSEKPARPRDRSALSVPRTNFHKNQRQGFRGWERGFGSSQICQCPLAMLRVMRRRG
jgi:hypothetical protein